MNIPAVRYSVKFNKNSASLSKFLKEQFSCAIIVKIHHILRIIVIAVRFSFKLSVAWRALINRNRTMPNFIYIMLFRMFSPLSSFNKSNGRRCWDLMRFALIRVDDLINRKNASRYIVLSQSSIHLNCSTTVLSRQLDETGKIR